MSIWNPRAVLDVYPEELDFSCVGTKRKGLRCKNSFISYQYLLQAGVILDSLSQVSLLRHTADEARLLATLRILSWLTLCPRWHQKPGRHSQTDTVAYKWLRILQSTAEHQRSRRQVRSVPTSSTSTPYLLSPPPTPSVQSPRPSQTGRSAAPSPETIRSSASPRPSATSSGGLPSRRSSTRAIHSEPSSPRNTSTTSSLSSTASSTTTFPPPTHSSARSAREYGSICGVAISGSVRAAGDLNLNVTINNQQTDPAHSSWRNNSHGSAPAPSMPSRSNPTRTPPHSPPASVPRSASSIGSGVSTTVGNAPITYNDIQHLLNRIESLETQLQQGTNRSSLRSSRSSDVSSRPVRRAPSSPALTIISDMSVPQSINPALLFLSSTQPPPSPPSGTLSISSDSSTSPATMTPSSSGTSSPLPLSPSPSARPSLSVTSTWPIRTRSSEASVPRVPSTTEVPCHMCRQSTANDATTHCRNECGKNYCTLCIGEWISSQLDDNREPSCPFCQVPWVF